MNATQVKFLTIIALGLLFIVKNVTAKLGFEKEWGDVNETHMAFVNTVDKSGIYFIKRKAHFTFPDVSFDEFGHQPVLN